MLHCLFFYIDSKEEHLPTPIYLLSDQFECSNCLFGYLTSEMGDPTTHMYDYCSPVSQSLSQSEKYIFRKPLSERILTADYSTLLLAFKPLLSLPTKRNYIPQIFCENFARDFSQVFLRTAGVFLLPIWCSDLAASPLTLFEQLLYRLRLFERHAKCADVKKVVIVGMHEGGDLRSVQTHVELLNTALFECDVYKQLFDQNKYKKAVYANQKHNFLFLFDTSQPIKSSNQLYMCIEQCMDVFAEKTKRFDPACYKSVFEGFDGLNNDLAKLSTTKGIVVSRKDQEMLYKQEGKPSHALETLQAYTTSLMDKSIPGEFSVK